MTEPAIDLGICLAIASSMKDIVIPDKLMAFGEIGLSGEVRAVSMAGQSAEAKSWTRDPAGSVQKLGGKS